MKNFLKKIWVYAKSSWKVIFAVLLFIVLLAFMKRRETGLVEQMNQIRDAHKKELEQIDYIRKQERDEREKNELMYKKIIEEIQKKYDEAKRDLDVQMKKDVKNMVAKYKDDPVALAEKVSAATGFKIIYPED